MKLVRVSIRAARCPVRTALVVATAIASSIACAPAHAAGAIAQTFRQVGGAVVVVRTVERAAPATGEARDGGRRASVAGIGSGVLVSRDGQVVTAAHVVQAADAVVVEFAGHPPVPARVVGSDPAADLALLQVASVPADATVATLGDSDRAEVGDEVFVVGAPFGITHTLTVGHVSARRQLNATSDGPLRSEVFQTDAAINPGNSGGPMFDLRGEVIGIVSYIVSRTGGSEGLGFVVTSNTARRILFDRPAVWSGIEGHLLTGELARAFNLPPGATGLLVKRVAAHSPAERLGLRGGELPATIADEQLVLGGDVILEVGGVPLGAPQADELIRQRVRVAVSKRRALEVVVLRAGERLVLVHPPS